MISPHVDVEVNLSRVRQNALDVAQRAGVEMIAVVKADAYGLGARQVAEAIGDLVAGFCVFTLEEAREANLWELAHKPILALAAALASPGDDAARQMREAHVRPAVWTTQQAQRLRAADPVLSVDTGMRRFACPPRDIESLLGLGHFTEAFTHAIRAEQAQELSSLLRGRNLRLHAAASALLDEPAARLDAVRPGIALYRGAVRVSTPLVEVRHGRDPAGYAGFVADRFGIILCGYLAGLRPGPCLIGGKTHSVLEVGMQSAFVEIGPDERLGDPVVLLGDSLRESEVADAWGVSEQNALLCLAGAGRRRYRME